ncbi:MAG TPA: hypothetical protein VFA60_12000 [Terriglobales bacterium]|nr:hypothetical protein [Terriglobales bacterium]
MPAVELQAVDQMASNWAREGTEAADEKQKDSQFAIERQVRARFRLLTTILLTPKLTPGRFRPIGVSQAIRFKCLHFC